MCAGVMARPDTAFVGFYAVEPKYQCIGIGRELWARCLERLDESINVGLYGVPSMSEKYFKTGFKLQDSIRMLIYESEPNNEKNLNLSALKSLDDLGVSNLELEVINRDTSPTKLKKLIDYDQSVHRYSREKLLKLYLNGDDTPLTFAIIKNNNRTRLSSSSPSNMHQDQDQQQFVHSINTERKSSCCAKPSQEAIFEDETLSTTAKSSLSISSINLGEFQPRSMSPIDIPSVSCVTSSSPSSSSPSVMGDFEVIGYGCIRQDNNSGGIIGPVYADSSDLCEVLLRNLMENFELPPGKVFSVMALTSNKQASKIMSKVGLNEIDQCTRMFTKFIPSATFSKIYYVHSPNFTLV